MSQSVLHRRHFLTFGCAASAFWMSDLSARSATLDGRIFSRSFAGSRTVSSFASGLSWVEDKMPLALRRAIATELARTDAPSYSPADERGQAEFFAWLAMRVIAPRALRRAGYEALAVGCENERHLQPGGAAALAQSKIGFDFRYSPMLGLASTAYGTSAHTSTCAFYAEHDEIEVVGQTGYYCARALLSGDYGVDAAELEWNWEVAVRAINEATRISSDHPQSA